MVTIQFLDQFLCMNIKKINFFRFVRFFKRTSAASEDKKSTVK